MRKGQILNEQNTHTHTRAHTHTHTHTHAHTRTCVLPNLTDAWKWEMKIDRQTDRQKSERILIEINGKRLI